MPKRTTERQSSLSRYIQVICYGSAINTFLSTAPTALTPSSTSTSSSASMSARKAGMFRHFLNHHLVEFFPRFVGELLGNGQQYAQRAKGALNLLPLSRHASSQTPTDPQTLSSQCHLPHTTKNNQTHFLELYKTSYRIFDTPH